MFCVGFSTMVPNAMVPRIPNSQYKAPVSCISRIPQNDIGKFSLVQAPTVQQDTCILVVVRVFFGRCFVGGVIASSILNSRIVLFFLPIFPDMQSTQNNGLSPRKNFCGPFSLATLKIEVLHSGTKHCKTWALWSPLDGVWGIVKGSWLVLVHSWDILGQQLLAANLGSQKPATAMHLMIRSFPEGPDTNI